MDKLFKALNDPTRRAILERLQEGELSAGEIAEGFAVSKPTISHHLDLLRQAGLILSEKDGQFVIYSLNTSVLEECFAWLLKMTKKQKDRSYETAEKRMAATPDPDHPLLRRRPAVG
jgi:DNA-binding transcriptional ArsR family regulator